MTVVSTHAASRFAIWPALVILTYIMASKQRIILVITHNHALFYDKDMPEYPLLVMYFIIIVVTDALG